MPVPAGPSDHLPALRDDLRIHPSSPLATGAPAWVILDPARHRYFQIGRAALEILSAWSVGTRTALKSALAARAGRTVSDREIDDVVAFLSAHELLRDAAGGGAALAAREARRQHHWLAWLVHNYLFVKIPLLRPQPFLDRCGPLARAVFSPWLVSAVLLCGLFALALVARRWDSFLATAASFLTLEGAAMYMVSLVAVKAVHELGHALMATRYGVKVPSMGVALMVMAPFLYSDVSDAWRLRSRRQRLAIDCAGILAELMLASVALVLWVFLPDGTARSIAFVTATTSLIMSFVLNMNPFMRFDGYHILADATGIPNLQTRAIVVGRWLMREVLFGLGADAPEPLPRRTLVILALYAYAIWIYRFFLFLGIALLVYHMAFKLLGIILFLIEIGWFIARPVLNELSVLWKGRAVLARRGRTYVTLAGVAGLAALAAVPWSTSVRVPAVAGAAADAALFPRAPGRIERIAVAPGATVAAGDPIVILQSPDLDSELLRAAQRIALLERRRDRAAADAGDRSEWAVLGRQLEAERRRAAALEAQRADLVLRAPVAGVLREFDPALVPGAWVGVRTPVGRIVGPGRTEIRGYVAEADMRRLSPGAAGRFVPEDPMLPQAPVTLAGLGQTAVEEIELAPLAAAYEGPVKVVQDGRRLRAGEAVYPATLEAAGPAPSSLVRGTAVLEGRRESFAARVARQVVGVLIRESGA